MATTKPNILLFFTDQQRWDTLGVNGNPTGLTPNLDRLARANTHAPLAFTCQPVCGPARGCLQTGQYASTNGCLTNTHGLDPKATNLGERFKEAGYDTGYIGKWHLVGRGTQGGPVAPEYRRGYDHWLAADVLEMVSDAYETVLYDGEGREHRLPGYRVDAMTDAGIRFISEPREQPFFLTLSFLEPHHQNHRDDYPAPTGYADLYKDAWMPPDLRHLPGVHPPHMPGGTAGKDWPGYCGMVKRLDEALGRIEDALRSTGQLDNTIVVFFADHGCHFKTRNAEYKRSCQDASVRIPMVFAGPGFRGGGRLEQMTSLVDIPATILDAAGLGVPESMQGRSILPLTKGETADWPEEVFFQISESCIGRGLRTKRWKYAVVAPDLEGRDAPGPDTRYVEDHLYDLYSDPWELDNIVDSENHREVKEDLRQRLADFMERIGEPRPVIEPFPNEIKRGQRRLRGTAR